MANYPEYFEEMYSDKTDDWWRVADYVSDNPRQTITAEEIADDADVTVQYAREVMDELEEAGWAQTEKPAKIVTWNHTDPFGHPADYDILRGVKGLSANIIQLFAEYGKTINRALLLIPALLIGALILDVTVWLATMANGTEPFFSTFSVVKRCVAYGTTAIYLFMINIAVIKLSPKLTLPEWVPGVEEVRDSIRR